VEVNVTGLPIVVHDEDVGVYGIAEDTTKRKRLERELMGVQSVAEQAIDAESQFLAKGHRDPHVPHVLGHLKQVVASTQPTDGGMPWTR
jgi:hypothetical protein